MKKMLEQKIETVIREHEKKERIKVTYVRVDKIKPIGFKTTETFKIDYGTE